MEGMLPVPGEAGALTVSGLPSVAYPANSPTENPHSAISATTRAFIREGWDGFRLLRPGWNAIPLIRRMMMYAKTNTTIRVRNTVIVSGNYVIDLMCLCWCAGA